MILQAKHCHKFSISITRLFGKLSSGTMCRSIVFGQASSAIWFRPIVVGQSSNGSVNCLRPIVTGSTVTRSNVPSAD